MPFDYEEPPHGLDGPSSYRPPGAHRPSSAKRRRHSVRVDQRGPRYSRARLPAKSHSNTSTNADLYGQPCSVMLCKQRPYSTGSNRRFRMLRERHRRHLIHEYATTT